MKITITKSSERIKPGIYVEFDTEEGPKTGFVTEIRHDVTNGRRYALIEIDNELDTATHTMPVDQLTASKKYNFESIRFIKKTAIDNHATV